MNEIKNKERFAEIERVLMITDLHIAPVMTRKNIFRKSNSKMAEYLKSRRYSQYNGICNIHAYPLTLKLTGEWNSKTTEDYIAMCNDKFTGNEDFKDLSKYQ